eukprot:TRINITY_DN193_c14_g1_i1.p1 TRINITY_DN193_c14_g1~~TRINITY_DN193_c14_g1_i1.p1  ORF type:complete len:272 (+),score=71.38 TRINITY_DN193_c14_g1_i1:47-817(+)
MASIHMFLATQFSELKFKTTKKQGMNRIVAIAQRVVPTTPAALQLVEDSKRLIGCADETVGILEAAGEDWKPLGWGDEAVVVDMGYLQSLPRDIATFVVAERLEQVSQKSNARQRRALDISMAVGVLAGAAVVAYRAGQAKTLRRAFTTSILVTVAASCIQFSAAEYANVCYSLERVAAKVSATNPDLVKRAYDFEAQKLQAVEADITELKSQLDSAGGVATEDLIQKDRTLFFRRYEGQMRKEALSRHIPAASSA